MTIAWSAHLSMLFGEVSPLERPAAARRAGFGEVESWWPGDHADAWADRVMAEGLRVAALNAYGGDLAKGERGFLNDAGRRHEAVAAFDEALALAGRVGARGINVLIGRELPETPHARQLGVVADALTELAAHADGTGVTILLEPINDQDVPGYLAPTPRAVADLIEQTDAPGVRLLFDAYHAARMGLDPTAAARDMGPLIGHVQFADCPGRGAPGTGGLDLWRLVEVLAAGGYEGAIGLEYDPAGRTEPTLAFLGDAPPAAPFDRA